MNTGEIITAIMVFVLAGALLVLAVRHFLERGVPLNNAWLFASREERKTMNKRPHYRQSAVVFLILGLVFVVVGLSIALQSEKLLLLEIPLVAGVIIYAILSSVQTNKDIDKKDTD